MRTRNTRVGIEKGFAIAVIIICIALVFALPSIFAWVDCNTATRNLTYVEICERDGRCTLTALELKRYKGYLRMQAMSCARED